MSELLLGFGAIEKFASKALSQEEVDEIFAAWMADIPDSRRFYFHSDNYALERLLTALGLPHDTDIAEISPEAQEKALAIVTAPQHLGCGHVKFTTNHPDLYGLSATLPGNYVRAFYKYMWTGEHRNRVNYVVLHGPHAEKAVLIVKDVQTKHEDGTSPQIAPDAEVSAFVAHAGLVHHGIRNRVAAFATKQLKDRFGKGDADEAEVLKAMDEIANIQLVQTVTRLAPELPIYEVTVNAK